MVFFLCMLFSCNFRCLKILVRVIFSVMVHTLCDNARTLVFLRFGHGVVAVSASFVVFVLNPVSFVYC